MNGERPLHLWEYGHPYYASSGCYFVPGNRWDEVHSVWESWKDFYEAWGNNDPDLNLLYRWDWRRPDPDDYEFELEENPDFEMPGDTLRLYFMLQRKAKPFSHEVAVTEADEPAVREWLTERAKTIQAIWEPILGDSS